MGDYTKLIVNADVEADFEELQAQIKILNLCDSAYHCGGNVESIKKDEFETGDFFTLVLVGQTKYGRRQEEFLDWLALHVRKGNGPSDAYSIQFTEHHPEPTIRYKNWDDE